MEYLSLVVDLLAPLVAVGVAIYMSRRQHKSIMEQAEKQHKDSIAGNQLNDIQNQFYCIERFQYIAEYLSVEFDKAMKELNKFKSDKTFSTLKSIRVLEEDVILAKKLAYKMALFLPPKSMPYFLLYIRWLDLSLGAIYNCNNAVKLKEDGVRSQAVKKFKRASVNLEKMADKARKEKESQDAVIESYLE